ncbi:50S ribosomal protein L7ae-like protein [Alkalicoccobacillus porphyridii]|uniref:RNA-binding protein FN960_19385 n=1 Tax=Alkalicoccobacillus porphyridii TaxID=2597270 RepID=A0A553ZTU0_9BACI|nr:50S ribosomal protein L7ae-like protein [Alkalicoccobacillus porphyridii]TSB44882.1 50S ribosomal protein L7ae-like protein [Alkalicoccobacillus porphyridii]
MSYEKVEQGLHPFIGLKQTLKALDEDLVSELVVASDAETRVVSQAEQKAQAKRIPIVYVDSMRELGKACGIDVGAATVALRK